MYKNKRWMKIHLNRDVVEIHTTRYCVIYTNGIRNKYFLEKEINKYFHFDDRKVGLLDLNETLRSYV